MSVNVKRLASGQLSLFDTDSQQMIIVEPAGVATVTAAADPSAAWTAALGLVDSGQAQLLNKKQLASVHQATSYLVMLTGSTEWPP